MVKEKLEQEQVVGSKVTIYKKLLEAQKNYKSAVKDASNPFFKSSYADLGGIWEACRDALHQQGLFVSQQLGLKQLDSGVYVNTLITKIYDESGDHISSEMGVQQKENNNMQSFGSGITYARRYALAAILGIITEDDDGNAASGKSTQAPTKSVPAARVEPKIEPKKDVVEEDKRSSYIDTPAGSMLSKAYFVKMSQLGIDGEEAKDKVKKAFKLESYRDVTKEQLQNVMQSVDKKVKEKDEDFINSLDGGVEGL